MELLLLLAKDERNPYLHHFHNHLSESILNETKDWIVDSGLLENEVADIFAETANGRVRNWGPHSAFVMSLFNEEVS